MTTQPDAYEDATEVEDVPRVATQTATPRAVPICRNVEYTAVPVENRVGGSSAIGAGAVAFAVTAL
jgi:hypothetical protein